MDYQAKRRRQMIRVALTEFLMVVAIVGIVGVLVAVVSGWRLSSGLSVEQHGLVQIDSVPSGATVTIDGETMLARTDMSRMLTEGEHEIVLQKDGYEEWRKTVTAEPGWLVRLKYPRLFKQNRRREDIANLGPELGLASFAPTRQSLLYAGTDLGSWRWVSLKNDTPTEKIIPVASILARSDGEEPATITAITELRWNRNGDAVLAQVTVAGKSRWLWINLRTPEASLDLSAALADPTDLQPANETSDKLWALSRGKLYIFDTTTGQQSEALLSGVASFTARRERLLYVTTPDKKGTRRIGLYEEGEASGSVIYTLDGTGDNTDAIQTALTEYTGEKYLAYTIGQRLYVYRGSEWPTSGNGMRGMEMVVEGRALSGPATAIDVSRNGEFILLTTAGGLTVFDAELTKVTSYTGTATGWLDEYLLYTAEDGRLTAWDFDGDNRRTLVVDDASTPAVITPNNKWLYYLTTSGTLRRERL